MFVQLIKSFGFDAAHRLPEFPDGHKCRNLHGHTYRVDVVVAGDIPEGQPHLIDFGDIRKAYEPLQQQLDHAYLNDIEGLEATTAEMIAKWLWDRLKPILPLLTLIRVYETADNCCEYGGPDWRGTSR
jgi:6-pyruvoyltetrahydropterin/6-carboxytetrahydropterin synthase